MRFAWVRNAAAIGLAGIVIACFVRWDVSAAEADSPPPLHRFDREVAHFPVPGDTLRVIATVLSEQPGDKWKEEVEVIRIVDRFGQVQFVDSLHPRLAPDGSLIGGSEVLAEAVQWDSAPGLRLELSVWPAWYPPSPMDRRYFVLRGRRLAPVTIWCSDTEGPKPGDQILFRPWLRYFFVRVPARVRVDRPEGGLELTPDRDASSAGLAVLELNDVPERLFYDEDMHRVTDPNLRLRVTLFRAPIGEAADDVVVTPSSSVTVGRVYADVELVMADDPYSYYRVDVKIRRLEVTIEGRHGFIEERDFTRIGLYEL